MTFTIGNRVFWRRLILAGFIVSMLGPWSFDLLSVPAQHECGKPAVRLAGDFCGYPMSGFGAFLWVSGFAPSLLAGLAGGNIGARLPESIALVSMWIAVLPFFSTILLARNKGSRRLQLINLAAWGLAGLTVLPMFALQAGREQVLPFLYLLWGLWLYILVATGAVTFEILLLRPKPEPDRGK